MDNVFQVRIDYIKHLVPSANSGKKEWYVVGVSREYQESNNFIGFEHLPDVFLTPDYYASIKDHIVVGEILTPDFDIQLINGNMSLRITGFKI